MSNAHGVVIKNGVLLEWKTCDRYVRIPDTVKIIGQNAIPKGAETVEIPNSVIEIGEGAFCGCYNLERIVIPESVTKIGSRSFSGCESLCSVVIENGDVEIGESAFVDCEKLADANGFVIVKDILFNYFGCDADVEVPQGVTYINSFAFTNGDSIRSIVLPDSVTKIGDYAFTFTQNLQSVTMGGNVQEVGTDLFDYGAQVAICAPMGSYAEGLANELGLSFVPNGQAKTPNNHASDFVIENGVLVQYKGHAVNVVIPSNVTVIGDRAFVDHQHIRSVVIPDNAKKIGWAAFSGCIALEQVTLPRTLTHISGLAFQHCKQLTQIVLPDQMKELGARVFEGCGSLAGNIVIPNCITKIGLNTFAGCANLESITIGDGVKYIHEEAFKQCGKLKRISFPASVELICKHAFYGCIALEEVAFSPASQAVVEAEVFVFCPHLKEIEIPNGLQIKESTFSETTTLKYREGFYLSKDKRCVAIAKNIPIRTPEEYAYAWLYQGGKAWQEYLRAATVDAEATLAVMADLLCADKKVKSVVQKNLVVFWDENKARIGTAVKQKILEQLSAKHNAVASQLK